MGVLKRNFETNQTTGTVELNDMLFTLEVTMKEKRIGGRTHKQKFKFKDKQTALDKYRLFVSVPDELKVTGLKFG